MKRIKRRGLTAVVLALVAVPAFAQFSEGYNFLKAVRARDGQKVEQIVSNPSSTAINSRDSGSGESALHIVVRGRDYTWAKFLLAKGARADLQSNDGTTPLGVAARIGWVEGAELLLGRGANPNLANSSGETPLIFAVHNRDLPMVRLLLSRGADPAHADSVAGMSALDYARRDNRAAAVLRLLEDPPARPAAVMGPTR